MKASGTSFAQRLLWLGPFVVAVALGTLVYLRAVNGPFIWDDEVLVQQLDMHTGEGWWQIFTTGFLIDPSGGKAAFYRPIIVASLLFDRALWGDNTLGYHLTNLFFHAITILFVGVLTWQILRSRIAAIASAFLFAVHPIHADSVCWISGRTDVICAAFLIPGICAYMEYYRSKRRGFLVLSLVLILLALMSKELAVLSPVLIALSAWASGVRDYRKLLKDAIPYVVLAVVFLGARHFVLKEAMAPSVLVPPKARAAIIGFSLFAHLQMLLLPWTAKLGYGYLPNQIINNTSLLRGAFVCALAFCFWSISLTMPILFFGMAWFLVTIGLISGITGPYLAGLVAQRLLYIPSFGLAIVFGWLIAKAVESSRYVRYAGLALALGVIVAFSFLSVKQSVLYTDDVIFWQRFIKDVPLNPAAYYNLGVAYVSSGEPERAISYLRKAIKLAPSIAMNYYAMGQALSQLNRVDEAITYFEKAAHLDPNNEIIQQGLMEIYERKRAEIGLPGQPHQ